MSGDQRPTVRVASGDETVTFAARELADYLAEMLGGSVPVEEGEAYDPDADCVWVGVAEDVDTADLPAVDRSDLDDAFHVDVDGTSGFVAGSQPRSVLLGAYRYLRELGCRWVRPGPDGEVVPSREELEPVTIREAPSYRHRGITIEGAVSERHVRDIVDWAPKVGYNAYFIQFFDSYPFFERWYTHENNPRMEPEAFSEERAREIHEACIEAIEKRDLLYHAVGHGWTARALDFPSKGWADVDVDVSEEKREYLAKVDGERTLYDDVPVNTELCYSNPEARRLLVESIADYADDHPEVDVLHFWASDGHNNHCECADCRGTRPSDFYVEMLNDLDDLLTERGLDTQIAFLIYTDLLWPPETETIENEERFSLMYAPITRSYTETYAEADVPAQLPPYQRNDNEFPSNLGENVAFLRAWQDLFDGDSFVFDYHLMWNHFNDPTTVRAADVLAEDMHDLAEIGLDGNVSCQVQRVFFPTGLPMVAMGETLWNQDADFEAVADDHFAAEFGEDSDAAREYLETLADRFGPLYESDESLITESGGPTGEDAASSFDDVADVVEEFRPTIERNRERLDGIAGQSWTYLAHHADLCEALAPALAARTRGDDERARGQWAEARDLVTELEPEIHPAFDVYYFTRIYDDKFDYEAGDEPSL